MEMPLGDDFLASLPDSSGVYRFYDKNNRLLYVGKAKNLKKRISSYFRADLSFRIQRMVGQIARSEITLTQNEKEALLLESNLIKHLKPKYNVLLRDDKSYPYLWISSDRFPRLSLYRGAREEDGTFFGPYPSAQLVRTTLDTLQRVFQIRSCSNGFFKSRKRPCLQYQLKRCTAPCCALVSEKNYHQQVRDCVGALKGELQEALASLVKQMNHYAEQKLYEKAAVIRDQIQSLQKLQQKQSVVASQKTESADIVVLIFQATGACIGHLSIRESAVVESQNFLLSDWLYLEASDLLERFLVQYYSRFESLSIPSVIYVEGLSDERLTLLRSLFQEVSLEPLLKEEGSLSHWAHLARENAQNTLQSMMDKRSQHQNRWEDLKKHLHLPKEASLMVCFDISHALGEATFASCVVFEHGQPLKSAYRRFKLKTSSGDDYQAMKEALEHYVGLLHSGELMVPDLIVIDGGLGQLNAAVSIIHEASYDVPLLGIAKGLMRRALKETLWVCYPQQEASVIELGSHALAFHVLRYIRDESHRVAIGAHRRQRLKNRNDSILETISGIGPQKAKRLLAYFGGLQGLKVADVEQIAKVPGISVSLAQRVYEAMRGKKGEEK